MESIILIQFAIIVALVLFNAFFAASEIAIVSARKTRIKQLAEEKHHSGALAVLRLTDNPSRFLATIQVGVTLASFFASAVSAVTAVGMLEQLLQGVPVAFVSHAAAPIALAVVTLSIAFFTLIFGELIPKNLAVNYAESIALAVARPIEWTAVFFTPVVAVLVATTNFILYLLGSKERAKMPEMTEDEIRSIIEAGEEEGVVEPMELRMIQGVFDFGDMVVREVMVPRIDIVAVEKDSAIDESVRLFLQAGYSRVPVYDGSLDNIVGVLYAKDLLRYFGGLVEAESVTPLMRPVYFVPESKKVSELFTELQRGRRHLAIVVDEYGGTAGLVTLEDLLEEIVGEIHDEYDTMETQTVITGPGEAVVTGKVSLGDLNDILDLDLKSEGEYDTVGGLIYSKLGRIPNPGDKVVVDGTDLTVLSIQGRRIRQVRVVRIR
ncbi:MAG: hemolysin family protein [Chloroflexi bacterium]|nr:hemolysin family protein [Chloroflexota bacterium]